MGLADPSHHAVYHAFAKTDRLEQRDQIPAYAGIVRVLLWLPALPDVRVAGSVLLGIGHAARRL